MNKLSLITPPDDFEQGVFVKTLLQKLDPAQPPPSFEEQVMGRVRKPGNVRWLVTSAGITLIVSGLISVFWISATPQLVRVAAVPKIEGMHINLENLPPAPYHEYTFNQTSDIRSPKNVSVVHRQHFAGH